MNKKEKNDKRSEHDGGYRQVDIVTPMEVIEHDDMEISIP